MSLKIGSKVAVIDDVYRGVVVAINKHSDEISVKTNDDMVFKFAMTELVKIEEDQGELSKYSDINNKLLLSKKNESNNNKSLFKKHKKEIFLEIDLHIQQLTKSVKGMDNFDMLNLQLDTAKRKLDYSLSKGISKIIFIHGVGEGVLKSELHSLLNKYPVKYYDASYKKYGLGATEVYIYQNK